MAGILARFGVVGPKRARPLLGSNAGVPTMDQQRPRWRFRISTLMLLILVVGLAIAIIMDCQRRRVVEEVAPPYKGWPGCGLLR